MRILISLLLTISCFGQDVMVVRRRIAGGTVQVGQLSLQGGSSGFTSGTIRCGEPWVAGHTGDITSISVAASAGAASKNMKVGLYSGAGTSLTKVGTEVVVSSSVGWSTIVFRDFSLGASKIAVTSGTTYRICTEVQDSGFWTVSQGTTAQADARAYLTGVTYGDTWPAGPTTFAVSAAIYAFKGVLTY